MNRLFEAAKELVDFCGRRGWRCCLIGGLAVQRWGEPRATLDADLVLFCDWGNEERYIDPILSCFRQRIDDARTFALENRVLLIVATNGVSVDIALGALPFELRMIERATRVEFERDVALPCCSAEDLFVMKVFAGRSRDLADAENIVARKHDLDLNYILENLTELAQLKGDEALLVRARKILDDKT